MTLIRLRRGTTADWTTANPILLEGEPGMDTDTGEVRIGDGVSHWADLPTDHRYGDQASADALDPASTSAFKDKIASITLGPKTDALFLRSSSDGDQKTNLTNFLADTSLSGDRRIVGYAKVSDNVPVPAGVRVRGDGCTIEQTGSSKTMLTLGAKAEVTGFSFLGKTTDYVAGSGAPTAIGAKLNGDGAAVVDCEFVGFAGAAIYGLNAPNARIFDARVYGVDGLAGIDIAALDSACFGLYFSAGCTDVEIETLRAQDLSIGVIGSYDTTGLRFRHGRFNNIPGQHGVYIQTGDDVKVLDIRGKDVNLNLVKLQLSASLAADSRGASFHDILGRSIGDNVISINNPATDLSTAKKARAVSISKIMAVDCSRVAYIGSIRGGSLKQLEADNTTLAVITVLDTQDFQIEGITSRLSGRQVITFTNSASVAAGGVGSATQRVRIRGVQGYNPGQTGVTADQNGIFVTGTTPATGADWTDGVDITVEDFSFHSDDGKMRSALLVNAAAHQESFRAKHGRSVGHTVAPFQVASATRMLGRWDDMEGGTTSTVNFPTNLPVPCGSMGDRTLWTCAQLPTAGVFTKGDWIANSLPAASSTPGWVATATGGIHNGNWIASTAYAVGDWRRTSVGKVLECFVAGTSGTVEPSPTTIGSKVTDGTVTWIYRSVGLTALKAMANVGA